MDERLWPARNVAEYAYCPRLFYCIAVAAFNRGELTEGHFQRTAAGCALAATIINQSLPQADAGMVVV